MIEITFTVGGSGNGIVKITGMSLAELITNAQEFAKDLQRLHGNMKPGVNVQGFIGDIHLFFPMTEDTVQTIVEQLNQGRSAVTIR